LLDASSKAEALLNEEIATKPQLKEMIAQLDEARQALVSKTDKHMLAELIQKAEQLSAQAYTADSWNALQNALDQAKIVMADDNATQTQIDEVADALQKAIDQLQKVKDP